MKSFYIGGEIVATDGDRQTYEDVCSSQIVNFLKGLDKNEEVEIQINSLGGSVFSGLQIYNALRNASKTGHKITTHCTSIAASIASIILMAGDEIIIDSNSFICIHLPWTGVQGNAEDLKKEIETLEKITNQMVEIYSTKMNITKEDILNYLKEETWFSAEEFAGICNAKINATSDIARIAASMKNKIGKLFNKLPEIEEIVNLEKSIMEENKENIEQALEQIEQPIENNEEKEIVENKEEIKDETVTIAECEKRISGMQSKMAKHIDTIKNEYEAKISEFKNQLDAKDKELMEMQNSVTSLNEKLETVFAELSEKTSALEQSKNALAMLNGSVNSTPEKIEKPISNDWRNLEGEDFRNYLKSHNNIIKNK